MSDVQSIYDFLRDHPALDDFWNDIGLAGDRLREKIRETCSHPEWQAIRRWEVIEVSPVKMDTRWLDIPNGDDGDYRVPRSDARLWHVADRQLIGEEQYTCKLCGLVDRGERLAP